MPCKARTDKGASVRASSPCATTTKPSGFSRSEATFAISLLDPMPTDAVRPVSSLIRALSLSPISRIGPPDSSAPVMSRYASSSDIGSTSRAEVGPDALAGRSATSR